MINHLRDDFEVEPVCRELGLSVSAYNARRRQPESAPRLRDEQLLTKIRAAYTHSGETYGARRIHRQLRREGVVAARCTIERLMREDGVEGSSEAGDVGPTSRSRPPRARRTWSTGSSPQPGRTSSGWRT